MVDFVCVVELSGFLGEFRDIGWRRGFGFWVVVLLCSCGVMGGEIEGDLVVKSFFSLLFSACFHVCN